MIRQNQKLFNGFHIFIDYLLLVGALALSFWLALSFLGDGDSPFLFEGRAVTWAAYGAAALLHLLIYHFLHIYHSYRNVPFWIQATELAKANLAAYIVLLVALGLGGYLPEAQVAITVFFFLSTGLQIGYRGALRRILRHIRKKGYNKKFVVLVGYNDCAPKFVEKVRSSPGFGYEISGYLASKAVPEAVLPFLGPSSGLETYLQRHMVDEVFLMLDEANSPELEGHMTVLEKYGVKFSLIPNIFAALPSRVYVTTFDTMPVLGIRKIPLDNLLNSFMKRFFDICLSVLFLMVFSPLFLAAAVAVRLSSPGPVIFRQTRVGINRKPFEMYKFRSMRVETQGIVKMAEIHDERCTRVGAFLRKYSIDELPQLINVLKGEMSLVGPRPEIPYYVNQFMQYIPSYMIKHYVRPGLTGWAQVHGLRGGDTSIEERIRYDMEYIENWSLGQDIQILAKTAFHLRSDKTRPA